MAKPRLFFLFLKTALAGASFGLAILAMMWAFRVSESEPVAVIEKPLPAPGSSIVMLPEDQPLPTFEPTHMRQPPTEVTEPPVPAQPEPEPEPEPVVPLPAVTVQPPQRIPAVKPEAPRTPHDRYKVTLRSVHVRPNYQNPANGYVHVKALLVSPKEEPGLIGYRGGITVTVASVDGFTPAYLQTGRASSINVGYDHDAKGREVSAFFDLPLTTKKLDFLDGIIHLRREKSAQTVSWSPARKSLNVTRTQGEFDFTLREFSILDNKLTTRCEMKLPERAKDAPDSDPFAFVRETVHFSDGTSEAAGPLYGVPGISTRSWNLRDRAPVSFEVRFVTEMEEEEFPFRLEDVFVPLLEEGRFFAAIPQLEPRPSANGTTYKITNLHSEDNTNGHALHLSMIAKFPPELNVVAVSDRLLDAEGFDDTGKRMYMLSDSARYVSKLSTPNEWSCGFQMSLPSATAQRIAIFKGTHRVAIGEKTAMHQVAIPSINGQVKPLKRDGPIQFLSVTRKDNFVSIQLSNAQSLDKKEHWKTWMSTTVLVDRKGNKLKSISSHTSNHDLEKPALLNYEFKLDGFDPAHAETTILTEGRVLIFDFSFIDLPLRLPLPLK